jgi:DegV family protein with EDD domain
MPHSVHYNLPAIAQFVDLGQPKDAFMPGVAIVTDSTADLPKADVDRWNIHVIPAVLSVEGKTLADGRDMSRSELYRRLPQMDVLPTTAAPPPGEFASIYEGILNRGAEAVLSIHLAQRLSGLYAMAVQAAAQFGDRVVAFDSRQASLALGFQVLEVAEVASQGGDLRTLLAVARSVRERARVTALVDNLRYLRRSGRVGWLQGSVGEVLRLRMVIDMLNGEVRRVAQTRTRRQAEQILLEHVKGWGRLARVAAMHVAAPQAADELAHLLDPLCERRPLLAEATTVIGTHVGPGAVGVAALVA